MKKQTVVSGGSILSLLFLGVIFYYGYHMATIATGYSAKILCSCIFVADRTAESGLQGELQNFGYVSTEVDMEQKVVTANIAGIAQKTAIYREGLGCTLVNEKPLEEIAELSFTPPPFPYDPDTLPWPMGELDTLPMPQGVDFGQLEAVSNQLFEEPNPEMLQNTRGLIIIYKGKILLEKYGEGFDPTTRLGGWSMTKSVTNALIGLLVKDGKLNIEQPAPIPAWQEEGDPRGEITLNNLMHMSSGLEFTEQYFGYTDATRMLFDSYSASQYAIQSSLIAEPGTEWYYSSGTTNILSAIVRNQFATDQAYWAYPYERLFHKIGMKSTIIEADGSGTFVGSSFMFATARDWARFGLLFLNEGQWNGEEILSEDWVAYSQKAAPAAPQGQYAAQFWANAGESGNPENRPFPEAPADMYYASGFEGQNIAIVPSKELVVVRLGLTFNREAWDLGNFVGKVVAALPNKP